MIEHELIALIGVSPEQMRGLRALCQEGTHWYAAEKGAIHWTDAGLKKIESLLDVEFSKKKEPSPVTAVTVTKITVNTRVVSAIAPDGSVITVLGIRDNRLLTPKQKIPAALGDDGKWRWHGPQPKRKGRLIS